MRETSVFYEAVDCMPQLAGNETLLVLICSRVLEVCFHDTSNWYFNTLDEGDWQSLLLVFHCPPWLIYKWLSYAVCFFCLVIATSQLKEEIKLRWTKRRQKTPIFSSTSGENVCLLLHETTVLVIHSSPFHDDFFLWKGTALIWIVLLPSQEAHVLNITLCPVLLPVFCHLFGKHHIVMCRFILKIVLGSSGFVVD